MSQHDLTIDNAAGSAVRADLNLALQALGSTSIGSSAPATLQTGQLWIDNSGTPWILKVYDGAQHITIGNINASTNVFLYAGSGASLTAGTTPLTTLDIDGGTDIGEAIVSADLFVIDNGAGGTNRKTAASRLTTYLFSNTANLTAGYSTTIHDAGTKSTGTYTPDEADGNMQKAVNGGAHTLAPPANDCTLVIQYTNNASAGTITTSGFTLVDGDDLTTTNGHDFFFYITNSDAFSLLTVKALQ